MMPAWNKLLILLPLPTELFRRVEPGTPPDVRGGVTGLSIISLPVSVSKSPEDLVAIAPARKHLFLSIFGFSSSSACKGADVSMILSVP